MTGASSSLISGASALFTSSGSSGVASLNSLTGALSLTSTGATIVITPSGSTINLEASGGSSVAFTAITSGTNIAAAMVVGSGASIATTGTGTIAATSAPAAGLTGATLASGVTTSSLTSLGTLTGLSIAGTETITSASATALTIGPNGATNPMLKIDGSVASAATGWSIQGQAAGSDVVMQVTSSGTNENGRIVSKGTGNIYLDTGASGGSVILRNAGSSKLQVSSSAITASLPLAMGTNNITMTGSLAATGARVTKGWFTDIESTNAPTIGGTAATGSGGLVLANSPTLVTAALGSSMATTQSPGDNSTKLATTAYVATAVTSGGFTRTITSISTATAGAAAAKTDYVYLVSGTTTFTLPTAVGNTNFYTVTNVDVNVVTIATTGGQTINGGSTIPLNNQWDSLSFISNNSNWIIQ